MTKIDRPGVRLAARRRFLGWVAGALPMLLGGRHAQAARGGGADELVVYTFGDSILDCGRYNAYGVHPGQLLVRNDERLFPAFHGKDLSTLGRCRLEHRAQDGTTIDSLARQAEGIKDEIRAGGPALALVTIGHNDLLLGLAADRGEGVAAFAAKLERFLQDLPIRPVVLGTVYDPTFGDERQNFLPVAPALARANLRRINARIARLAARYGTLADLHAHFLAGDPAWFTQTTKPSLTGASEVRRVFLQTAIPILPERPRPASPRLKLKRSVR